MDFALSRTGQFTVNKALLKHLGVKPGDRVSIELLPDASMRVSAASKKRPLSELRGAFRDLLGVVDTLSLEDMEQAIADGCLASGMAGMESKK
jgi:bifunctional DNA-binding transcriptional regulator/antitoxin component of YhaV-PrlF toxin-antitoxin module